MEQSRIFARHDYASRIPYGKVLDDMKEIGSRLVAGFTIDKYNEFAYENIAKWLVGDPSMQSCLIDKDRRTDIVPGSLNKGIYLAGGTGTGKTLALTIFSQIAYKHALSYTSGGSFKALFWPNIRADRIVSQYQVEGDINHFIGRDCPTLAIQDFGTEPPEANYMGSRVDVIRYVVENRCDDMTKITLYTSNIPLWNSEKLIARYGERVYDRLRGTNNYLKMTGPSRRK